MTARDREPTDPQAAHPHSSAPEQPSAAPAATALDPARWVHRLRNELNTANMACAAAQAVLAGGAVAKAQENLDRARKACARAAALLDQAPPSG